MSIADLRHGRSVTLKNLISLAEKPRLKDVQIIEFERLKNAIQSHGARIERAVISAISRSTRRSMRCRPAVAR